MIHWVLMILVASSLGCSVRQKTGPAGEGERSAHELDFRGEPRGYNLYVPRLPEGEKVPLMIVLHGGLGNAESIERTTGMNAVADSGGFVVAYPQGTGAVFARAGNRRTWNAGVCCGQAVRRNVDDVGFLSAMIDDIAANQPIDLRRVYVAGLSNGGMLAYRLAAEVPEKLAAIVVVSGTLAVDDCSRSKDVPVLHIHGDHDTNVPFEGGRGEDSVSRVSHRSVPETLRMLTEPRGCEGSETKALGSQLEETTWRCSQGALVRLLVVRGGVHEWPGGRAERAGDEGSAVLDASRTAWDFARQFTRKD